MIYLTVKQASDHLRLDIDDSGSPTDERMEELELKIDSAESAVLSYLEVEQEGSPGAWPWDETNVPPEVRSATLIVLAKLWDKIGIPFAPDGPEVELLRRRRPPALA